MRRSNPKLSFDPGFSLAGKILILIVLGCFLVFFGLALAEEAIGPDFEDPWDDLKSPPEEGLPVPHLAGSVTVLPYGHLGACIVIDFPQAKSGKIEKDRVEVDSSGKVQGKLFILF
jgi:hypothetical protein